MSARYAFAAVLAVLLLTGPRVGAQAPPPPYPNPPPYPLYPDPGPAPSEAPWPSGGVPLCVAPGDQRDLSGTDDYAHGAYFAWSDHRGSDFDVYATRVGPDGQPAPGWNANGNLVAGGAGDQTLVRCVNDGPWGTFVVWIDLGTGSPQLYVQKLGPSGGPAPSWPSGGRAICLDGTQGTVSAFSDHQGGLQFLWIGLHEGRTYAIAYHMAPDGSPYPGWPACGIEAAQVYGDSSTTCCAHYSNSITDATPCWPDGMFVGERGVNTWCDLCCQYCGYFQCYSSEFFQGATFTQTESDDQCGTSAYWPDEAGGFFQFKYHDARFVARTGVLGHPSWVRSDLLTTPPVLASGDGSYYFQFFSTVLRVLDDGTNAPGWTSPVPICDPPCSEAATPGFAPDGAGNLFAAWPDARSGAPGLYATLITAGGSRGVIWPASGFPVAVGAPNLDLGPVVTDRRGNAIVGWRDDRRGEYDLYAYRLSNDVPVPVLASLVSTSATPQQVDIVWWVPSAPGALTVERREVGGAWQWLAEVMPDRGGQARVVDTKVHPGARYDYRLSTSEHDVLSETSVEVPAALPFAFEGARPNPASGLEIAFTLPDERDVVLHLWDVAGRQVLTRDLGVTGPGHQTVVLARRGQLALGVYFVEIEAGQTHGVRRAVVVR